MSEVGMSAHFVGPPFPGGMGCQHSAWSKLDPGATPDWHAHRWHFRRYLRRAEGGSKNCAELRGVAHCAELRNALPDLRVLIPVDVLARVLVPRPPGISIGFGVCARPPRLREPARVVVLPMGERCIVRAGRRGSCRGSRRRRRRRGLQDALPAEAPLRPREASALRPLEARELCRRPVAVDREPDPVERVLDHLAAVRGPRRDRGVSGRGERPEAERDREREDEHLHRWRGG